MLTIITVHEIQMPRSCDAAANIATLVSKHSVPPASDMTGIFPRPSTCTFGRRKPHTIISRNRGAGRFRERHRHHGRGRGREPSASSATSPAASISVKRSAACMPNLPSSASSAMTRDMARTVRARYARACASEARSALRCCSSRSWWRAPSIWPVRRTARRCPRRMADCSRSARATPELVPMRSSARPMKANQFVARSRALAREPFVKPIIWAWTPAMNAPW